MPESNGDTIVCPKCEFQVDTTGLVTNSWCVAIVLSFPTCLPTEPN